jgi:hypothetical protein
MKKIKFIFILLAIFALPLVSLPDPPGPPGQTGTPGPGNGNNQTPVGAPIDGGMGILLALGVAYGSKKLYNLRKEKATPETGE